jgi:phosphoribosylformimino-5-aminoimidazole carboxamide ribonucleotide (ProFAR) isomerase
MMQGTDLTWFAQLRRVTSLPITAAGGITTLDDVQALLDMNIDAAIGMAVYTGSLRLDDLAMMMQQ